VTPLETWLRHRTSPDSIRQLVFLTIHTTHATLTKDSPVVRELVGRLRAAAAPVGSVGLPQAYESDIAVHVYGPEADAMLRALVPVVQSSPVVVRAWALVRFGDVGAPEIQLALEGSALQPA
jgi:hypothetical protein